MNYNKKMVYHYYDAYVAFGFVDNMHDRIISKKSVEEFEDIHIYATEIRHGYIYKAFIGFYCEIDPKTGIPTMDQNKYNTLMEFVEKYRTYHGIHDEEQLNLEYRPVFCGDFELFEDPYDLEFDSDDDDDDDSDSDSDSESDSDSD